jgi:uncharacterized protein involved in exopolysaccharide biosynthesis
MSTESVHIPVGRGTGSGFDLARLLGAIRRRFWSMAITFVAVMAVAGAAALFWPAIYRSTGTILIEQQEMPSDFVRSAVTSYADQRVQMISQRVMTSANLLRIVEKYKLYGKDRDTRTREELTDRMRRDVNMRLISAEVMDPRQGRATKATIAFSVAFENRSPLTAARVANELTTLYLSENIDSRRQLAAGTADFLGDESARLGRNVAELEAKVAKFKEQNGERLPEYQQFNLQSMEGSRQELRDLDTRVRSLDQQVVFLDSQLVQLDPSGLIYSENGERLLSPRDRLKVLRSQLASAEALYGSEHPDVQRYRREMQGLEQQLGGAAAEDSNELARRLTAARGELAAASERYAPGHPDVDRLTREVQSLERSLTAVSSTATRSREAGADNPAYIQIRAQKTAALNERASLMKQAEQVRTRISEISARQAAAPAVEQDYSVLLRDLQGEREKYGEVRQKQLEAQLAQNLETERKGERFTLIEPPTEPTRPVFPNRPLVALLGLALACAAAVGVMFAREQLDTTVRDRTHLLQLVGVPPLAVIPMLGGDEDMAANAPPRRRAG